MRIIWSLDWRADVQAYQSLVMVGNVGQPGHEKELAVMVQPKPGAFAGNRGALVEIMHRQVDHVLDAMTDPDYAGPARTREPMQPVQPVPLEEVMR